MFYLYKHGLPHNVVVNEKLELISNKLKYCRTYDQNFLGPLLEKALVQLHFDGKYELAEGVHAVNVLTRFINTFFERFYCIHIDNKYTQLSYLGKNCFTTESSSSGQCIDDRTLFEIYDVITYGLETNSLMVVNFKNNLPEHIIITL